MISYSSSEYDSVMLQLFKFAIELIKNIQLLLLETWFLLLPVIIFVIFVIYNGGIVVGKSFMVLHILPSFCFSKSRPLLTTGDKNNHTPVFHPAMPCHLVLMISAVAGPYDMFHWLLRSITSHSPQPIKGGQCNT